MNYEKKLALAKEALDSGSYDKETIEYIFPELKKSDDERIRKALIDGFTVMKDSKNCGKTFSNHNIPVVDILVWLEKQGEMDMESYKAVEDEKREFVGDGFIRCYADFQDFKEGETYWLEYVGNDNYNVRSDNLLGKTYHITPCQLYTIFKKMTWLEKQGEQKPACAWSEEDEKMLVDAYVMLDWYKGNNWWTARRIKDWLETLKTRYTWKPSDEQMATLYKYAEQNNYDGSILTSLYNELKKLREE